MISFPDHLPLTKLPLADSDFTSLQIRIQTKQENIDQLVLLLSDPSKRVGVPISTNCPVMLPHVQGVHETVPVNVLHARLAEATIEHWWLAKYSAEHLKRAQTA